MCVVKEGFGKGVKSKGSQIFVIGVGEVYRSGVEEVCRSGVKEVCRSGKGL